MERVVSVVECVLSHFPCRCFRSSFIRELEILEGNILRLCSRLGWKTFEKGCLVCFYFVPSCEGCKDNR